MSSDFTYRDYVTDRKFADGYRAYQTRYAETIRESDRVIIEHVRQIVEAAPEGRRPLRLLDAGCSTGNLLLHLKRLVPELDLTGGDLMEEIIAECRENPDLEGIRFEQMDMLDIDADEPYDIVVTNAVLYMFDDEQFEQAIASAADALRPGGSLVAFDFFHPYHQDLAILETSRSHPEGLMLHFRPFDRVRPILSDSGFDEAAFEPFTISIDLEKGSTYGDNRDGFEDLNSYTVTTEDTDRMIFRGTLFTPWCHLIAQKKED